MMLGAAFFLLALMATICLALHRAMVTRPDATALFPNQLNAMLISIIGWTVLVLLAAFSAYLFGLVLPAMAGIALYLGFRASRSLDLTPFYGLGTIFAVATLGATVILLAQNLMQRSTGP